MFAALCNQTSNTLLPLISAALGFGVLITAHEFGHFLFAKAFGFRTPAFSIGFGPKLLHFNWWDCEFRLSLLPLGGYCAIEGMDDDGEGLPQNTSGPQSSAPYWQKTLVLLGGIGFNILLAYFVFSVTLIGHIQKTRTEITIATVVKESAAEKHSIKKGDVLRGYNDVTFSQQSEKTPNELTGFLQAISNSADKKMALHLNRCNQEITNTVTIAKKDTNSQTGSLGVSLEVAAKPIEGEYEYNSLLTAIRRGVAITHSYVWQTVRGLGNMFKQRTLDGVGGPVAMLSRTFEGAKSGLTNFLHLIGVISVGLAVMNLIPIVPFDGGRFFIITLEAIIGRPLHEKLKELIMMTGLGLVLALFLFLSYRDIFRLFGWL
ncbi:MAG: M50 family metallopeptidase [Candidatus Dependentiae bacterium]|jgi:regulator of sigma E protease